MLNIKTTADKVNRGIRLIQQQGGQVESKNDSGSVSIKGVKARFSWNGDTQTLSIVVDDKPWLATDRMIKEKILEFFGS